MKKLETEFYGTSTVGERGQIVIPASARESLKIKAGDKFVFIGHGQMLHILKAEKMDQIFEQIHRQFETAINKIKSENKNQGEE